MTSSSSFQIDIKTPSTICRVSAHRAPPLPLHSTHAWKKPLRTQLCKWREGKNKIFSSSLAQGSMRNLIKPNHISTGHTTKAENGKKGRRRRVCCIRSAWLIKLKCFACCCCVCVCVERKLIFELIKRARNAGRGRKRRGEGSGTEAR